MPSQHLRQMNGRINSFFFSIRTKKFSFQVTLHLMTVSVRSQKTNLIEKLFLTQTRMKYKLTALMTQSL